MKQSVGGKDGVGEGIISQVSSHFLLQFSSVQFSRSVVSDSVTPWIAARQASLSITNSRSSLRPTSIESVMPSSHLILCRPLLLLLPIPPSIRVFSNESTLHMRWPKYWILAKVSPSLHSLYCIYPGHTLMTTQKVRSYPIKAAFHPNLEVVGS